MPETTMPETTYTTLAVTLPGGGGILRDHDGAFIPADPRNTDWQAYQAWLAAGNVPRAGARTAGP